MSCWPVISAAAEVTIDSTASTVAAEHNTGGRTVVFTDDQTGYRFYVDSTGSCSYRKSVDAGGSWGAAVQFDSSTNCSNLTVWYDQWTPGDTGSMIHLLSMDASSNELRYNRLDTSADSLLLGSSPINASVGQTPTLSVGANIPALTKGTDGTVYIAVADDADAFVQECSSSCNLTGSWSETGTNPLDTSIGDLQTLVPLLGGDIMVISRNRTDDYVLSKVWDNTAWDASWTVVDGTAPENSDYELALSAVTNPSTGRVHLAYVADHNNFSTADHDIRTAYFDAGSWTSGSAITTNDSRGLTDISLALDQNTGDVYVTFGARSTLSDQTTTNIYWASSTAAMSSWSGEQGPLNTATDDFYGIDSTFSSDQRLYATWYADADTAIRGDTIVDIVPPLTASAIGAHVTEVRGDTTNVYLGGAFVLQEFGPGRDVTNITITESGSVDGANDLDNIRLLYEYDSTAPYDCQSVGYDGGELQFGATDTNGFSGGNGTASFADTVSVTSTSTLCVYVLLDVLDGAADGQTIDVAIDNPNTDVLVTGGFSAQPNTSVAPTGVTTVVYPNLIQSAYHWRNDDGSESAATSATGGAENTQLIDLPRETPIRMRMAVSNNGSTSTIPSTLRLEYGEANPACSDVASWTVVDAANDAWNVSNSVNLTNGNDTTDIAVSTGGITNPNTTFLSPNGGVLDTTTQTSALSIDTNEFVEYEFSLVASSTATQGSTYCFRLTDGGSELTYSRYPAVSIAADVTVESVGSQTATVDIGTSNNYLGGAFTFTEVAATRNVTTITVSETGSIDAAANLANVELFYENDTTAPYDCAAETYSGTEAQFGTTVAAGFNAPDGTVSFSDSASISPTSTLCIYPVYDVTSGAQNGDTIDFAITAPHLEVVVSGGAVVGPDTAVAIASSTEAIGAIVTQAHYHWRNDDGNEASATSATGGSEDQPILEVNKNEAYRLRLGLANAGGTSTADVSYQLQFGIKESSCEVISTWTDVSAVTNDSWDMSDSTFLTHGDNTTNIAVSNGGVSDGIGTFITPNSGVLDTNDVTATTTIDSTDYIEYEFSLTATPNTPFETDYCFRVVENGQPLTAYDAYPEVSMKENRDFKVQRGVETISATSSTLTAGVDYEAPAGTSTAFVRITNAHFTGAGNDSGGNQNPDDVTAYITTSDLTSSFTIERDTDSFNNTRVAWEIIEFIGASGTDNEMVVRDVGTLSLSSSQNQATSSASSVNDDNDVVVFVTGMRLTTNLRNEYDNGLVTTNWDAATDRAVVTRANSDEDVDVGYAVVEFVGQNWSIQRVEHTFAAAGIAETESITPVTSVTQAFVEGQKRMTSFPDQSNFGYQAWLSSIGAVSFFLDTNATSPSNHTAVAWVVENTQIGNGAMEVYQANGTSAGGAEPLTQSISFTAGGVNDTSNASIWGQTSHNEVSNSFPKVLAGFRLNSTSTFELYRTDTGGTLSYRTQVVQWPAADVAVRQNYYRWYDNQNALTPSDPWPTGGTDLGENMSITPTDTPVGEGDVLRLRVSYVIANGSLAANLQQLKLQYGYLAEGETCSAVGTWNDVGSPGSGAIWRGFDNGAVSDDVALGTNPPGAGETLLSVSDRAGRYVEGGAASQNPYTVQDEEDVEYDWVIQQNGAVQRSDYCFRTVKPDGTPLDGYLQYPVVRTQGYEPEQLDWRWYEDGGVTPSTPLAAENVTPVEVEKNENVRLRIVVDEINNLEQTDARFRLQFSDSADFSTVTDVANAGTCSVSDIWCYADGPGIDNATITAAVISSADTCAGATTTGCGTYIESPTVLTGYTHPAQTAVEFDITVQYQEVSGYYGQVWYFRMFDAVNGEAVPLNGGASYPSLVGESGSITFTVAGVSSGTTTEGVVTDATTTATAVPFGALEFDTPVQAAQRLSVDTNAVGGYRLQLYERQPLQNADGTTIADIAGTNAAPTDWSSGCSGLASCFGYHAGDDTLSGTASRFSLDDSYAALVSTPAEIMYSPVPVSETEDILYQLVVRGSQPPGDYTTDIVYVITPVF